MLDGDHYKTQQLVDELMSNAVNRHWLDLIDTLNPSLTVVNKDSKAFYCYNYKGIIVSFGETVHDAMKDFQSKFYNQKAKEFV